jgi:hypothetical protein
MKIGMGTTNWLKEVTVDNDERWEYRVTIGLNLKGEGHTRKCLRGSL